MATSSYLVTTAFSHILPHSMPARNLISHNNNSEEKVPTGISLSLAIISGVAGGASSSRSRSPSAISIPVPIPVAVRIPREVSFGPKHLQLSQHFVAVVAISL